MRFTLFTLLISIPMLALLLYLVILIIRALRKYVKGAPVREENKAVRASLSEKLRENRMRCKMTQEFVAEALLGTVVYPPLQIGVTGRPTGAKLRKLHRMTSSSQRNREKSIPNLPADIVRSLEKKPLFPVPQGKKIEKIRSVQVQTG